MRSEEFMLHGEYLKWKNVHGVKLKQLVFLLSNDFKNSILKKKKIVIQLDE